MRLGSVPLPAHSVEMITAEPTPRRTSFHKIVTCVSIVVGLSLCAAVAALIVQNARQAISDETESAFRTAQVSVSIRMPARFSGQDTMGDALRLSADIDALRHVSSNVFDTNGKPLVTRAVALQPEDEAEYDPPDWFIALMRPQIQSDVFPVAHYPNILGTFRISTDPNDEIAEVWEDFRLIMPLLGLTSFAMVGLMMLISSMIHHRLETLRTALVAIQMDDTSRRAPVGRLIEFANLAEGVNELADHLTAERAENKMLQARLINLSETERAKIASDLHDELGPQLFALNATITQARSIARKADEGTRARLLDVLDATESHARAVGDSARAAIKDLRPMLLGHGSLHELLDELVADFSEISPEVTITLDTDFKVGIGELAELSVHRFARESVLNAIRHGKARHVRIELHRNDPQHPGQVVARITDDGKGPSGGPPVRGHGQIGIRDRAQALGAVYLPPQRRGDQTITELRMPLR